MKSGKDPARPCNIDRGKFCQAMDSALDHSRTRSLDVVSHYPTEALVVVFRRTMKEGLLTLKLCPFCGVSLTAKKIVAFRAAHLKKRAARLVTAGAAS